MYVHSRVVEEHSEERSDATRRAVERCKDGAVRRTSVVEYSSEQAQHR